MAPTPTTTIKATLTLSKTVSATDPIETTKFKKNCYQRTNCFSLKVDGSTPKKTDTIKYTKPKNSSPSVDLEITVKPKNKIKSIALYDQEGPAVIPTSSNIVQNTNQITEAMNFNVMGTKTSVTEKLYVLVKTSDDKFWALDPQLQIDQGSAI